MCDRHPDSHSADDSGGASELGIQRYIRMLQAKIRGLFLFLRSLAILAGLDVSDVIPFMQSGL